MISFELYAAVVGRALNWKYQGFETGNLFIQESGGSQTLNLVPDAGNAIWQNGFQGQLASTGGPNNLYGSLTVVGSNFQDTNSQYNFPGTRSTTFGGLLNSGSGAAQEPWILNGVSAAYFPGSGVESGGTIATIKLADVFYSYGSSLSAGTSTVQPLGFFSSSQPSTPAGHWIMDATKLPAPPSGGTNALVNYNTNPASGPSSLQTGFGFMGSGFESTTAVTVAYSPPALGLYPTSGIAGLRVVQGSASQPALLTVSNSGYSPGNFQLTSGTGDAIAFGVSGSGSLSGYGAIIQSTVGWANTGVTGPRNGQAVLSGLSPGDVGSPHAVAVTGAVVTDRVVSAAPITLGRFMSSSFISGSSTLSTTGDDNDYTRVTVNGTLFNSATTTSTYTLASGTYSPGAVSGSVSLPVTGEGLAGEGSYAGVVVSYSGNSLLNRVVTAGPANSIIHLGQTISQPVTLSTTGVDSQYTRVRVGNAGPDGNGAAISGGANPLFNGPSVTDARTFSCTPAAAGVTSGTLTLATGGEGLAGESPVPVPVAYSIQVFSGNAQWSGTSSTGSWGVNANWTDTGAAGVHAAPGVWGFIGDAATLGAGIAGTITLDGASPSLAALTFSNSTAGYTIAAGSGGTLSMASGSGAASLTDAAGSHTIGAPLVLTGSLNLAVSNPGDTLTVSGPVTGSGGLTKLGSGGLVLAGNCSYTGSTTINSGLVQVVSNGALGPATAAVTVNGGTLAVNQGGLVDAGPALNNSGGSVALNGGTIRASAFTGQPMAFASGTLEYKNNLTASPSDWLCNTLGQDDPIPFGKQLKVDGTTTVNTVLTLSGGTLSTGSLVNPYSWLNFVSGTFNLTSDNLSISPGGLFGSALALPAGKVVNVTNSAGIAAGASLTMQGGGFSAASLSNSGTIGGSGQINAPLANAPGGLVRTVISSDDPVFTGGSNVNQGQIELSYGATVQFTGALTNSPGGLITGNGNLIVGGGLLNSGTMALSAVCNISGTVQNNLGGLVNTAGGTTTFWNNVVNNGTVRTSIGSFTVFYGAVSGTGAFTGPGTASFESDLSTGQSPAAISFANQAFFDNTSQINIQLGGTTAGNQYDQLNVAGAATLAGGGLNVSLVNGFRPTHDEQFTVLTSGSLNGAFATETGLNFGRTAAVGPLVHSQQPRADGRARRFRRVAIRRQRGSFGGHQLERRPARCPRRHRHFRAGHHAGADGDPRRANHVRPASAQ